jgi:hypothetical protein
VLERRLLGYELPLSAEEAGAHLDVTEARDQATTGDKAGVTLHLSIGEMFPAHRSTSSSGSFQPVSGGSNVMYVRVVETDAYADWESDDREASAGSTGGMDARVGNRPDAEDLTPGVFRTALGLLRIAASKGDVRSYLLDTAQTVLAWHWRPSLGRSVTSIEPESGPDYLANLPHRYRPILELRFLEANTIKEAPRTMDIGVSKAKVLQRRAFALAAKVSEDHER